jgi:phosphate-selective porin OprO and OprP
MTTRLLALAFLLVATSAFAQTAPAPVAPPAAGTAKQPSVYDRIWRWTEWYASDTNPVVQRVVLSGRFQHDYASIDASQGDLSEWNLRRLRIGPRITLFKKLLLHAEVDLNPQESDPFYLRTTDVSLQWTESNALAVTVGKQSVPFTMDGATSSKELLTIDRSNLANNIWFPQEYLSGVSVSGRVAPWVYRAGVYSAGEANREFGEFNGGAAALGVLGYDFAKVLGVREALLSGNYVYQSPDTHNTFTRQLEHIGSLNFKFDAGTWGVRTDVSAAAGYLGQSDMVATMMMPFFSVTDRLQLVARHTFISSDKPNGVRLATYESRLVAGRGDRYGEWYGGANYYFYGHKLKLQTGLQHARMRDRANDGGTYSGLAWTTGLRIGWP